MEGDFLTDSIDFDKVGGYCNHHNLFVQFLDEQADVFDTED